MTMTRTCLSQQNIIIKHQDGYESKNLFIKYCEKTKLNLIFGHLARPSSE